MRMLVPYAPGGAVDSLARLLSQKMSESFHQTIVVENAPGAAGVLAVNALMRSPSDGHTLLLADSQFIIAPMLLKTPPYDPVKDLAPVGLAGTVPLFFLVKNDKPWKNLQQMIDYAKANPGKPLTYGTAGVGSVHHLSMEAFKAASNLNLVHVPYKGSGQSVQGILAGDIDILVASPTSVQAHIEAGTLRQLAVTSGTRSPFAPNVPSIAETYGGYDYSTGIGLLAPAATPLALRERISAALNAVLKLPDVSQRLTKVNQIIISGAGPTEYAEIIKTDSARFATAVKQAGISVDN
ncbi:tripartite tricarboxylate transporter substrate-binding protein [uncultured Pigmentiphaga sp.]|uniref:Bug family tripartite tricarboxylate transporter substrate binding protein n=1 Tax=uncultured Pigmentiphaga sp. TaxID=340361 RepID=UPI002617D0DE|nr:tripartite tricarboxylate transporter substrate-binding protein [uncultured Pigmentiphaga sp.]